MVALSSALNQLLARLARRCLAACSKHLGRPQAHAMETIPVSELKDPQFSFYMCHIPEGCWEIMEKRWKIWEKG